jgi:LPS-assembly lipoprotein
MTAVLRGLVAACLVGALAACGFELRRDLPLSPALARVHVEAVDPASPVARGVRNELARQGATLAPAADGVTVVRIAVDQVAQEALTISRAARVQEFVIRHRVEFEVVDASGAVLLPRATVELARDFVFDETQALGAQAQGDLLRRELARDVERAVLERLARVR